MEALRIVEGWDEDPAAEYLSLGREVTMLQARMADQLARIDAEGLYESEGYLSASAFVRHRCGVSAGEATRRVAEARALRQHREIRQAYATAVLDRPRVAMLLGAAKVSEESFTRDEQMLVDTVSGLSMKESYRAIEYWKQAADPGAADADAEDRFERRRLHVSDMLDGMLRIDGVADADGRSVLLAALRSVTDSQQLDACDTRTPAQRRHDALIEICGFYMEHRDTPMSGGTKPQVLAIISLEALMGKAGAMCEFDDGAVITPEMARRIACDSSVTRVITGPRSEVLDVGRATRTIPAAIRKALIVRDRNCQAEGCDRPHQWCEAHHIIHWADGGRTILINLILLCRQHHRAVHEGKVRLPALE